MPQLRPCVPANGEPRPQARDSRGCVLACRSSITSGEVIKIALDTLAAPTHRPPAHEPASIPAPHASHTTDANMSGEEKKDEGTSAAKVGVAWSRDKAMWVVGWCWVVPDALSMRSPPRCTHVL